MRALVPVLAALSARVAVVAALPRPGVALPRGDAGGKPKYPVVDLAPGIAEPGPGRQGDLGGSAPVTAKSESPVTRVVTKTATPVTHVVKKTHFTKLVLVPTTVSLTSSVSAAAREPAVSMPPGPGTVPSAAASLGSDASPSSPCEEATPATLLLASGNGARIDATRPIPLVMWAPSTPRTVATAPRALFSPPPRAASHLHQPGWNGTLVLGHRPS